MLFDTHVHLNNDKLLKDLDHYLDDALTHGVTHMVTVGYDLESSYKAIEIASKYKNVYAAVGIHPTECLDTTSQDLDKIQEMLAHPKVVALGEIGLDYYWDSVPHDRQKEIFIKQIAIAKLCNKPVVIHSRDALKDTYDILKQEDITQIGGIMHCYPGSSEMAREFIKLNMYISLAGPVTFKNGRVAKEVAKTIPLDHLLIETDCPYLSPEPYRGKLNTPAHVRFVCQTIAQLNNISFEEVAKITFNNARKVFKINE